MPVIVENKYYLRSLHEEIDLLDRRLAHMASYEVFATEAARSLATAKAKDKREQFVKIAKRLVDQGIEYKESELPRSFRPKDAPPVHVEKPLEQEQLPASAPASALPAEPTDRSAYAGMSLDWKKTIAEYRKTKRKAEPAAPSADSSASS